MYQGGGGGARLICSNLMVYRPADDAKIHTDQTSILVTLDLSGSVIVVCCPGCPYQLSSTPEYKIGRIQYTLLPVDLND